MQKYLYKILHIPNSEYLVTAYDMGIFSLYTSAWKSKIDAYLCLLEMINNHNDSVLYDEIPPSFNDGVLLTITEFQIVKFPYTEELLDSSNYLNL